MQRPSSNTTYPAWERSARAILSKTLRLFRLVIPYVCSGHSAVAEDSATTSQSTVAAQQHSAGAADQLPYPPVDPGIPARQIDEVVASQKDLINRIKVCYGVDNLTFEKDLLPLIHRYAEFVHLLPATPNNYFNGPGGLLRLGLEVAFFSLQGTDGHIFSGRSTISVRRHLEPRWRQATFIAGLCCELHRTLSHVIVTDAQGDEWQPYLQPLSRWLARQNTSRYYLKWRPNAHESRSLGVFVLPHVIPETILQDLAADNDVVVPHMMASISGMALYREHNILDDLVRRSSALVIDRYLQASADRYGTPQLGSHLERYLVDALRRLVHSNSTWTPNGEKSRVWFGSDGLFLVWPNAAAEIRSLLESDQLPGIPKAPETILEILVAAGVFEPQSPSQTTWHIVPPDNKIALEAVKLSSPAILFSQLGSTPEPLSIALMRAVPGPANNVPNQSVPLLDPAKIDSKRRPAEQLPLLPVEAESPIERPPAASPNAVAADPLPPKPHTKDLTAPASKISPSQKATTPLQQFKLDAPMRLNSALRDALAQIVDTLNGETSLAACTVSSGLFIPLAELVCRKIEPPQALRALSEARMLVLHNDSQTLAHDFGGEKKIGLLLHPRFVVGLDPDNFDVPT